MLYKKNHILLGFLLIIFICHPSMADILTLKQAEKNALVNARGMIVGHELQEELSKQTDTMDKESAPSLQFGADYPKDVLPSLPTDDFEAIMLGIEQPLPELHSYALRTLTASYLARAQQAKNTFIETQVIQTVRDLWLSLYESLEMQHYIQEQITLSKQEKLTSQNAKQLIEMKQQLVQLKQQQYLLRKQFSHYVGKLALVASLPRHLPNWMPLPSQAILEAQLKNNPLLQADSHSVRASQQSLKLAAEHHNSGLNLSMGYGFQPGMTAESSEVNKSNLVTLQLSIALSTHANTTNDKLVEQHIRQLQQDQQRQRENFLTMKQALIESYKDWQYFNNQIAMCRIERIENEKFFIQNKLSKKSFMLNQMNQPSQSFSRKVSCLHAKVNRAKAQARVYYVLGK